MITTIALPEPVRIIIDSIKANGFDAYAVGGCIRDSLLQRMPHDWDVTTSASPAVVKRIFRRTFDTGIEHGTVTVLIKNTSIEVTTYRIDGDYEDNRHPSEVIFTKDLTEDLKRRDFTINAIAYNNSTGFVDPFNGFGDLSARIIRCVGNPNERFEEDALRILRAIRFSAQLGFTIESETEHAIKRNAALLKHISAERIASELIKLITSDSPEKLKAAYELGITKIILPEFDEMMATPQHSRHHLYNVGDHTVKAMQAIRPARILRLAMLLHDIGKPVVHVRDEDGTDHFRMHSLESERLAIQIMKRLKLDNETIRSVSTLVRFHDWHLDPDEGTVRLLVHYVGKDLFPLLMEIQQADLDAQSAYQRDIKQKRIDDSLKLFRVISERGDCTQVKELAIGGNDLLAIGVPKGPVIGEILNSALSEVLKDHTKNNKEYLLNFAKESELWKIS